MAHSMQQQEIEGFSFGVENVTPSEKTLGKYKIHDRLKKMLGRQMRFCSDYHADVCCKMTYQPFLAAVYTSYSLHLPLCLSPDAIWLTISQGVAHHMAVHGERLRRKFVAHEGKRQLKIRENNWMLESPENCWGEAFRMWTDQIRNCVGEEIYDKLVCNFTTTTSASRIASQIVMMDIFQCYFKYHMTAICGIPQITLRGTQADWDLLALQVRSLRIFEIDWWLDRLEPIVDQFAQARKGNVDEIHWQRICKLRDAYGGDVINGWVGYFFPYIKQFGQGPCNFKNPMFDMDEGISTYSAPSGLSEVPFIWEQSNNCKKRLTAIGGLVGVTQDPVTKQLEPIPGWAVFDSKPIDELIFQIQTLIVEPDKCQLQMSALEDPQEDQSLRDEVEIDNAMPEDLENLFRVYGDSFKLRFGVNQEIAFQLPQHCDALDWGEEPENDGFNSRGPYGKTWFAIGLTNTGEKLAINLHINHPIPELSEGVENSRVSGFDDFEINRPICVYTDASIGMPGLNPVICTSATQLIRTLIDKMIEPTGEFYWRKPDFVSLGDATEFTQLKTRSFASDQKKGKKGKQKRSNE